MSHADQTSHDDYSRLWDRMGPIAGPGADNLVLGFEIEEWLVDFSSDYRPIAVDGTVLTCITQKSSGLDSCMETTLSQPPLLSP